MVVLTHLGLCTTGSSNVDSLWPTIIVINLKLHGLALCETPEAVCDDVCLQQHAQKLSQSLVCLETALGKLRAKGDTSLCGLLRAPTWWTKMSALPSSGWMKPKPFETLNHFTIPAGRGENSLVQEAIKGEYEVRDVDKYATKEAARNQLQPANQRYLISDLKAVF